MYSLFFVVMMCFRGDSTTSALSPQDTQKDLKQPVCVLPKETQQYWLAGHHALHNDHEALERISYDHCIALWSVYHYIAMT